ncbi:MAG: helix-hairpin-helix domain-containing protein [Sphingobacteriia bacterium]|nr:MAG: helix-hairpin-helix domain-containing protein [Sphingobacteriia bacterium]
MKYSLSRFLVFSPKEWRGILFFLVLVLALWFWPDQSPRSLATKGAGSMGQPEPAGSAQMSGQNAGMYPGSFSRPEGSGVGAMGDPPALSAQRFYFDPNTLDSMGWVRLGLAPLPLRHLLHYRQKGGRFRQPKDLLRIWDMDPAWGQSVLSWIRLPAQTKGQLGTYRLNNENAFGKPFSHQGSSHYAATGKQTATDHLLGNKSYFKKAVSLLGINSANQADWEALPGIGPVLARRILRFREHLGGFKSVSQIAQTYGLTDSVFQALAPRLFLDSVPASPSAQKPFSTASIPSSHPPPSINHAQVSDLEKVGISTHVARAIVGFRRQNGPYLSLEDLKKIPFIQDSLLTVLSKRLRL